MKKERKGTIDTLTRSRSQLDEKILNYNGGRAREGIKVSEHYTLTL